MNSRRTLSPPFHPWCRWLPGVLAMLLALAPAPRAGETEAGFTPMFNGKDLAGWEGASGWWRVEDGTLTAESTQNKPCERANYLMWRGGLPGDFELRAEYRLQGESANSGIQFHSRELPDWDTFGYQADLRPYYQELQFRWSDFADFDGGGMVWGVSGWGTHSLDQLQCALGTDATGPVEIRPEDAGPKCRVTMRYANGILLKMEGKNRGMEDLGAIFVGDDEANRLLSRPRRKGYELPKIG